MVSSSFFFINQPQNGWVSFPLPFVGYRESFYLEEDCKRRINQVRLPGTTDDYIWRRCLPKPGIVDRNLCFHANVQGYWLVILVLPRPHRLTLEVNGARCLSTSGPSSVENASSIIKSAHYPENFLTFRPYSFALAALKARAESFIGS